MEQIYCIRLKDIPSKGLNLAIDDQNIWLDPIREYELPYKIKEDFCVEVFIQVEGDCCILKGLLKGTIETLCDRCLEKAEVKIEDFFRIIEKPKDRDSLDISFILEKNGELYLNLKGLLWERFVLNIPQKILCKEDCMGLCPICGANLNISRCNCGKDLGDPRLAIFRKIKILSEG
ncbi:YceD family protein [Desulfothermus sp.]